MRGRAIAKLKSRHVSYLFRRRQGRPRTAHVGMETYRWFACMLLLLLLLCLGLGGSLRLVLQTLASLAGVRLVWAAHTALVIDRMETAGGR